MHKWCGLGMLGVKNLVVEICDEVQSTARSSYTTTTTTTTTTSTTTTTTNNNNNNNNNIIIINNDNNNKTKLCSGPASRVHIGV